MSPQSYQAKELCESECFEKVYDTFAPKLLRYARLHLSSREDAEDVLATTFSRVWEYVLKNPQAQIDNMQAFLYRTMRNLVIDTYRSRKPQISTELLEEEGFEIREPRTDTTINRVDVALVLGHLDRLEPDERDLLLLRFVEDRPVKEIAAHYNISENNCSVRIHRTVKKLRDIIVRH